MIGFGSERATLHVYIDKRPPLDAYSNLTDCRALALGEVAEIGRLTGNHWRKIMNVYAKLLHGLQPVNSSTWQWFRDNKLLQSGADHSLCFDLPIFNNDACENIHLIMGKTYLQSITNKQDWLKNEMVWVDPYFAINKKYNLIACPYFDYRQLSNLKIERLHTIIRALIC